MFTRVRARLIAVLLCFGISQPALGQGEKSCKMLYRSGSFQKAAKCFLALLRRAKKLSQGASPAMQKDRLLRNAAFCYHQAATKAPSLERRGFLREKAVALLMRSFRRGYCEASDRCRANRSLAEEYRKQIGYGSLSVVAVPNARVTVQGYQFKASRSEQLHWQVRPGKYRIKVASGGKIRTHTIHIKPRHTALLDFSAARVKVIEKRVLVAAHTPAIIYAGYIVGGVLVVAGVVLAAYGLAEQARWRALLDDPSTARKITDEEFRTQHGRAEAFKIIGFTAGAAGVLSVVGALIGQLALGTSRKAQPKATRSLR